MRLLSSILILSFLALTATAQDYTISVQDSMYTKVVKQDSVQNLVVELLSETATLLRNREYYQQKINQIDDRLDTLSKWYDAYTDTTLTDIRENRIQKGNYLLTTNGNQYNMQLVKVNNNLFLSNTNQSIVGQVNVIDASLVKITWSAPATASGTTTEFKKPPNQSKWIGWFNGDRVELEKE